MKNLLFTLLFIALAGNMFGQEKSNCKMAISEFTAFYNTAQYDSIWQLFSPQMQNALPLEKSNSFFTQMKSRYGSIENNEYAETDSTVSIYKTRFANTILATRIALDRENKIAALRLVPLPPENLPKLTRNTTKLNLPFSGEWTVIWGGDTRELNYHADNNAQKNAFDILITDKAGRSFKTTGKANEDYYAFGQPVIAPCDAAVVLSVDGIKDNVPGELNPIYLTGNSVILRTKNNEYLFFAHFKQNSVKVKEGDHVKQGQTLGLCGNTGNSSEPHLHFHIQNVENMNIATGAKCYFDKIMVNGALKTDYSPIKNDKISNMP